MLRTSTHLTWMDSGVFSSKYLGYLVIHHSPDQDWRVLEDNK